MKYFLALDPGREKVGVAVLSFKGEVMWRGIVPVVELEGVIETLYTRFAFEESVVGDSTGKEKVTTILYQMGFKVSLVDERYSSEEARKLYFREGKLPWWKKLIPLSFLYPRGPYDDWQAVVIGRRYLEVRKEG